MKKLFYYIIICFFILSLIISPQILQLVKQESYDIPYSSTLTSTEPNSVPMPLLERPPLGNVMITSGKDYIVALKQDGTVSALGDNTYGQCTTTIENGFSDIVVIDAKNKHTVGLKNDGTVVAIGMNGHYQCNTTVQNGFADIVSLSAGHYHTIGLKKDGTVVAVGNN